MATKNIVLFCAGGMSTSLLVNKMRDAAKLQGREYEINAHGLGSVEKYGPDADVILLGPQVRYAQKNVQEQFPDTPVGFIDMRTYGTMDGAGTLKQAIELMKD